MQDKMEGTEEEMMSVPERKIDDLLPSSFKFHNFVAKVSDTAINFQIIKMENCLYLWIGDSNNPVMEDLSFALTSNFERQPIATKIIGSVADATSMNIARRLSTKLGKPVYVSFNVTADNIMLPAIERRIQEEFKTHTDLLDF